MKSFSLLIEQEDERTSVQVMNNCIKQEIIAVCLSVAIAKMKKDGNMSKDSILALVTGLLDVLDDEDQVLENITEVEVS